MQNLFEMLSKAQNGQAMEELAKQFNLSQAQAQEAVAALLPAFSQGLKRNTADTSGLGDFLNALSTGQHAKYFEDASRAFSAQGIEEGNGILGHLFGSKDLSRAVAGQAAQATGLGQQLLQQMLPVIASMVMGGLFKQSTGPAQSAGNSSDNPLGTLLQGMFGGGQSQTQNPLANSPWGKMLNDFLGGAQTPEQDLAPKQDPAKTSEPAKNPYGELFGQMFEAGRQQRDDYQKGMESIFDQFLRGMDRKG
ncbi:DUF937 domain-containing protein [Aquamicrobium segne]|uniref:DUF937 domain-containing protein n=1 Tax=Aquamicrobium segne TaxID=469547 RepID=A0ABW0GZ19_9HYPH